MNEVSIDVRRQNIARYDFREAHPAVRFGTASDRYAGWIGQIYTESYTAEVSSRSRRLGGRTFREETVPVRSVAEFFTHFGALEIDYTFYRPLLDKKGDPTNNYFLLREYAEHAPSGARFFLKVPQTYFARTLRRTRGGKATYEANPEFLDAAAYEAEFHRPAVEILGNMLGGFIFEQEYQRKSASPPVEQNIAELDEFFHATPSDVQPHIELRSEHLLTPPYFAWLEDRGIGFVLSHWTWLPPLRKQWRMCGEHFTAADGNVVVRLMTPLNMKYADAYALAHPFDKPVPELAESRQGEYMINDVTDLIHQAEQHGALLNIIINNRIWGNAPACAQRLAERILEEEARLH